MRWFLSNGVGAVYKNEVFEYGYAQRRSHTINEQRLLWVSEFYLKMYPA